MAPLAAALVLAGSGFLRELERTTEVTLALAEASEEAPRTTAAAAREVASLPEAAELTGRQADAFHALAVALDLSARRVFALDDALADQATAVRTLRTRLDGLGGPVRCVATELQRLLGAARAVPGTLAGLRTSIASLTRSQDKSVRHLRSINRKLAALGVVATASGVEAPEPPDLGPPGRSGPLEAKPGRCSPRL